MNLPASELAPGMEVRKGFVATPDPWVALGDPALDWSPGSGRVILCYADGTVSPPIPASQRIEYRSGNERSPQ